ncbi:hypothetical protein [Halosegnis rubeus]|uniref:Uncharacterized protein n=1 Tax=Halosegnis rubeus TaxID=2212850 RepID=A0A5N5UGW4_9EURY|nr:hypothetical protein [Halosegnis rubeus]KAB7517959.1 hypothetical protein DMP03_00920 [Halosegnis rubeus]
MELHMARWVLELFATSHTDRTGAVATPRPITGEFSTQPDVDTPDGSPATDTAPSEVVVSPAEALDYYALNFGQVPTRVWSQLRDRSKTAVRKNRRQAEATLAEERGHGVAGFQHTVYPAAPTTLTALTATHMAQWIVHVLNTFPPRETLNPLRATEYTRAEFDALSADAQDEIMDCWTPRQRQFFDEPATDKPTPVELCDYYFTEFHEFSHTEWGALRNRSREAVRKNTWQVGKKFQSLRDQSYLDVSVATFPLPQRSLTLA